MNQPPPDAELARFLHTMKGAALSCLFAFLALPNQSLGTDQLIQFTGYSDKTITQALRKLSLHGFAQRHARTTGWTATHHARQLLLGEIHNLDPQPEILRLAPCSSGSSIKEEDPSPPGPTTTTTTQPEILRLDRNLLNTLTQAGSPPDLAKTALTAALHRNEHPDTTKQRIDAWLRYCDTDQGNSINNPGALTACRIRDDFDAPGRSPTDYWRAFVTRDNAQ